MLSDSEDNKISDFFAIIDYLDIIEVNKMKLINEKAILSKNEFI